MNVIVTFADRRAARRTGASTPPDPARDPRDDFVAFASRCLQFALDRFAARIAAVALRVRDTNGPRGGRDQLCKLAVVQAHGPTLHLQTTEVSAEKAVHRLARRAARLLARVTRRSHRR